MCMLIWLVEIKSLHDMERLALGENAGVLRKVAPLQVPSK